MFCLGYFWQYTRTDWIQILARFVGWVLSRFFNRRCLWRCRRCYLSCFLLFGQRASCTFDRLFVRLPSLCLCVCLLCTLDFCLNIFLPFIQLLLFEQGYGYIRLLLKLILKFRNVLQHAESRSSFACNQNIKEDISVHSVVGFTLLWNETKQTDPPRKHPRNARVISTKEQGTMSENRLRGITLVRGPRWGSYLIISWSYIKI